MDLLRKKLESVKKNQREVKLPDYSAKSKEKLIQILTEREKDHRKIETFYRGQVDELESELCDARELIISLIDERNDVDFELTQVRKQRQEFKTQLQSIEIELSRKTLEKDELAHNLELAQKQTHRYSQLLEEEQQKIGMLNVQTSSLQEALGKEKQNQLETMKKLKKMQDELVLNEKMMEKLLAENTELRAKQNYVEEFTDESMKNAIMSLGMIILSKDMSYTLAPEQRYLIKHVFGEDCSKIIDKYEKKIKELNEKNKELRTNYSAIASITEVWLNEFLNLCDWVESQLDLLQNGDIEEVAENFAQKMTEILSKRKDAQEASSSQKSALKIAARFSVKERDESISSTSSIFGKNYQNEDAGKLQKRLSQKDKEIEELRAKLHDSYFLESQMRDQITELTSHSSALEKNSPKVELMRFLQCQASIVEDLINSEEAEQ